MQRYIKKIKETFLVAMYFLLGLLSAQELPKNFYLARQETQNFEKFETFDVSTSSYEEAIQNATALANQKHYEVLALISCEKIKQEKFYHCKKEAPRNEMLTWRVILLCLPLRFLPKDPGWVDPAPLPYSPDKGDFFLKRVSFLEYPPTLPKIVDQQNELLSYRESTDREKFFKLPFPGREPKGDPKELALEDVSRIFDEYSDFRVNISRPQPVPIDDFNPNPKRIPCFTKIFKPEKTDPCFPKPQYKDFFAVREGGCVSDGPKGGFKSHFLKSPKPFKKTD